MSERNREREIDLHRSENECETNRLGYFFLPNMVHNAARSFVVVVLSSAMPDEQRCEYDQSESTTFHSLSSSLSLSRSFNSDERILLSFSLHIETERKRKERMDDACSLEFNQIVRTSRKSNKYLIQQSSK